MPGAEITGCAALAQKTSILFANYLCTAGTASSSASRPHVPRRYAPTAIHFILPSPFLFNWRIFTTLMMRITYYNDSFLAFLFCLAYLFLDCLSHMKILSDDEPFTLRKKFLKFNRQINFYPIPPKGRGTDHDPATTEHNTSYVRLDHPQAGGRSFGPRFTSAKGEASRGKLQPIIIPGERRNQFSRAVLNVR